MSRYLLAERALADLEAIVDHVCDASGPERSEDLVRTLFSALERIAQMPGIGQRRQDLTEEDLRFWSVSGYLIVYRPGSSPLQVIRVLHGHQDVGVELERD